MCGVSTIITDKKKMKKIFTFSLIALFAFVSCVKKSDPALDNKDLVGEIFKAGMTWSSDVKGSLFKGAKGSTPINFTAEYTQYGPKGGKIHVTGGVTGSISWDNSTGNILGGTILIGLTETISDYAFESNGKTYTMNGAPYISLTGTFTLLAGGTSFGTASSIQIGGGARVTGSGYDKTTNINITIIVNSTGTGGRVSGTIGGESLNYSF
jgi:hypothetical protein